MNWADVHDCVSADNIESLKNNSLRDRILDRDFWNSGHDFWKGSEKIQKLIVLQPAFTILTPASNSDNEIDAYPYFCRKQRHHDSYLESRLIACYLYIYFCHGRFQARQEELKTAN